MWFAQLPGHWDESICLTILDHRRPHRCRRRRCRRRRRTAGRAAADRRSRPAGDAGPCARAAGRRAARGRRGMKAAAASRRQGTARPASGSATRRPAFARVRAGDGFIYRDADGKRIRKADELKRIQALAIPPAYEERLDLPPAQRPSAGDRPRCARPQAIPLSPRMAPRQATPTSSSACSSSAPRCRASARASRPTSRRRSARRPSRETVLATIVRLLDTTSCGSATRNTPRTNRSFGLTTLRNRHAAVSGSRLRLAFAARAARSTRSRSTIRASPSVVRRCQAMPGQDLFKYTTKRARPTSSARPTSTTTSASRRRRLHGQGLSHLARHGARAGAVDRAGRGRRSGAAQRQAAARRGRQAARQHGRGLQEGVRASARARGAGRASGRGRPGAPRDGRPARRPDRGRAPPARLPALIARERLRASRRRPLHSIYRSVDMFWPLRASGQETRLEEPLVRVSHVGQRPHADAQPARRR